MVRAPTHPYRRAMTWPRASDHTNRKATRMLNVVLSAIAHGTQVGSEGIIAILIGLLH
jgi:hypothetical protein